MHRADLYRGERRTADPPANRYKAAPPARRAPRAPDLRSARVKILPAPSGSRAGATRRASGKPRKRSRSVQGVSGLRVLRGKNSRGKNNPGKNNPGKSTLSKNSPDKRNPGKSNREMRPLLRAARVRTMTAPPRSGSGMLSPVF